MFFKVKWGFSRKWNLDFLENLSSKPRKIFLRLKCEENSVIDDSAFFDGDQVLKLSMFQRIHFVLEVYSTQILGD